MPYFREAKIQKVGALGATQLRELYKVKMTMIGNTLLKNGQYIYINPTAIGAGSPSSEQPNIARMLGLGGYFLVTSVSHRVSESGFEVTCEALHQSVPEGREGSVAIVAQAAAAEPAPNQRRRGKSKKKEKDWVAEQQEQVPAEIGAMQMGLEALGLPRWLARRHRSGPGVRRSGPGTRRHDRLRSDSERHCRPRAAYGRLERRRRDRYERSLAGLRPGHRGIRGT